MSQSPSHRATPVVALLTLTVMLVPLAMLTAPADAVVGPGIGVVTAQGTAFHTVHNGACNRAPVRVQVTVDLFTGVGTIVGASQCLTPLVPDAFTDCRGQLLELVSCGNPDVVGPNQAAGHYLTISSNGFTAYWDRATQGGTLEQVTGDLVCVPCLPP